MSVLDGVEIVFVARSDAAGRQITSSVRIGSRLPALSSASGRMLLSTRSDDEVRALVETAEFVPLTKYTVTDRGKLMAIIHRAHRDGYALNDQETEEGLLGIAVLLSDRSGRPVASLNANSHIGRLTKQVMIREFVPKMQHCANRLSELLL